MRIGIIGAGNVGRAIGGVWAAQGHHVVFGVREPGNEASGERIGFASVAETARGAEVIALAVPWDAAQDAIKTAGDLSGRIVIDCTNPLRMGPGGLELALGHSTSAAEQIASWARGAAVFKTLNQAGYEILGNARAYGPPAPVMFVAGDDASKKPAVLALVRDLGFDAVDAGSLTLARLLEPLAMLWINQAIIRKDGRDFAFAFTRKTPRG